MNPSDYQPETAVDLKTDPAPTPFGELLKKALEEKFPDEAEKMLKGEKETELKVSDKTENESEEKEKTIVFENILFKKEIKPDGEAVYKSSSYGRKIIILDRFSGQEPAVDHLYDVELVKDTQEGDPKKGVYFVRLKGPGLIISEKIRRELAENQSYDPIERDPESDRILVLEAELPYARKDSPDVPSPENFKHFTLDQRTLETIDKIATAVELKQPCLLEGETSTSKTSSIEYLAMRTGNEFVRFNLNGQTDTSEIIGKYVPNDGQLQLAYKKALENPELLSKETQTILCRANNEGRGLNLIESQRIAENERITIPEWRWQDGLLPEAMKHGKWIVFDEINLAEPQILERLNSVLEKNPSLTLSENGGYKIGSGGDSEVDENFRILATMNPAEYSGRKPMSPAYKDRWTSYMYVPAPSEKDYEAMIKLMVYGVQPNVKIRGNDYKGKDTEAMLETLGTLDNFEGFIPRLTKFQSNLEKMSKKGEIGRDKKEPYIFTRRGLIDLLHYLDKKSVVNRSNKERMSILNNPKEIILRALDYFFLDKISGEEDRKKVCDLMDAIGISRNKFLYKF
jgi:MoxR-like ATPase